MHQHDPASPELNLCELFMESDPSQSENNMMNNPSNASMLTTELSDRHCGFVGAQRSTRMCYQRVRWRAVCKKTETDTSKFCRCVHNVCVRAHTFTHTSTALFHFWNTVCHLAHRCTFTHPQWYVRTVRHTQTVSIPLCSSSWLWWIIGHSYAVV